jgi:hypothetical protein
MESKFCSDSVKASSEVLHFISHPAAALILHSNICCLVSGLLLAYKLDFMQHQRRTSERLQSGGHGCHVTYKNSSCPSHLELSVQVILTSAKVEMLHHVVFTFVFLLQEAHPLNKVAGHFIVNSCHKKLLKFSQLNVVQVTRLLLLHNVHLPNTMLGITLYYYKWTSLCPRV